ncbi:hypothetical protein BDR22DRAFT_819134 [Usnea florida]
MIPICALLTPWAISSTGVKNSSAVVKLAYAEYNRVSPPFEKTAHALFPGYMPRSTPKVLGILRLFGSRSVSICVFAKRFQKIRMSLHSQQSVNHDDGTRMQALALAENIIAHKIITAVTEISKSSP